MYVDVVLPLRLKQLTYKIPKGFDENLKGYIVKVPFRDKEAFGIIVDTIENPPLSNSTKEIIEIFRPFSNDRFVEFINWMSEYYLSSKGMALKATVFDYVVEVLTYKQKILQKTKNETTTTYQIDNLLLDTIDFLTDLIFKRDYKTLVIRPTCKSQEDSLLFSVAKRISDAISGVIILVPEIADIMRLEGTLRDIYGKRLAIFHSKMTKAKRIESVMSIINCDSDIVLGTRSSIFMPLQEISLIIVLSEHSLSYKAEEGLKYNARDLSVRLGYMNNCPVILSSIAPSVETVFNVKAKKYQHFISLNKERCKIKPVLHTFKNQLKRSISQDIISEAKKVIEKGGIFLFIGPREGYSLIFCKDCGSLLRCNQCNSSVVFYKDKASLACQDCNSQIPLSISCNHCKGFNLTTLGSGIDRIKEEIESQIDLTAKVLKKNHPISIDSSVDSLIVSNKVMTRQLSEGMFQGSAIIDFDYFIHKFGFRADEIALQEVIKVACMIEPKGYLYLQTNNINNSLINFIKSYDFNSFYSHQLELRKNVGYPPFKKILVMLINIKDLTLLDSARDLLKKININGVDVLGPIEVMNKTSKQGLKYLLKSSRKALLDEYIMEVQKNLGTLKGIELNIDVDPIYV